MAMHAHSSHQACAMIDTPPTRDGDHDHANEYPGCGLAIGMAPLGDMPVFQLLPGPLTLPVRDLPVPAAAGTTPP